MLIWDLRGRLRPAVFDTHPGYGHVTVAVLLAHVGLGIDSAATDHDLGWRLFGGGTGLIVLGVVHLVIAAALAVGLYLSWRIVRLAFIASVTTYSIVAVLFWSTWLVDLLSGLDWGWPFRAGVLHAVLASISAAAAQEPVVAGWYHDPDGGGWS